jgi:post-segregation antitoxin (ccd killing protein)
MATHHAAVKKSVTVDRELLDRLGPERTRNFSATVNEGLHLLAALDAQQELVDEWETENDQFVEADLRPFLETAMRAQIENTMRILAERQAAST